MPDVTAILPCRNEIDHIDECLRSLFAQQLNGMELEVIVADGMSDDGTRVVLEDWAAREFRLRVLDNAQRVMPSGMNLAIRNARSPLIVVMGVHCRYPSDFLWESVQVLKRTGAAVSGGVLLTQSAGTGMGANVVRAVSTHPFGVGGAGFRTGAAAGAADTVPYGCYRRSVLDRVGVFDERLVRNQDYELNARIRAAGGTIWMEPSIRVEYFNQASFAGLLRQAAANGRWNVFMWYLAPYSFRQRHAVPGLFTLFVGLSVLASAAFPSLMPVYFLVLAVYALLAILSGLQQARRLRLPKLALLLPFAFLAYHLTYGYGILRGAVDVMLGRMPFSRFSRPWEGATAFRLRPERTL